MGRFTVVERDPTYGLWGGASRLRRKKDASLRKKKWRRCWVPAGESVSVAGRELGGMIYVGRPPSIYNRGRMEKSCLFIDPSLPVAQSGSRRDGRWIHCWPSYYHMTSDCRATYLDWLMSGRSDPSYDFGNMLLYFYGIERRFLIDRPTHEEKVELLQEVRRLMGIYPDDPSVRRVLEAFIQIAEIQTSRVRDLSPIFEKQVRGMPLSLKVALGTHIDKGKALGADWLLSLLTCHGEYNSLIPATRCPEEFRELFRLRFE